MGLADPTTTTSTATAVPRWRVDAPPLREIPVGARVFGVGFRKHVDSARVERTIGSQTWTSYDTGWMRAEDLRLDLSDDPTMLLAIRLIRRMDPSMNALPVDVGSILWRLVDGRCTDDDRDAVAFALWRLKGLT